MEPHITKPFEQYSERLSAIREQVYCYESTSLANDDVAELLAMIYDIIHRPAQPENQVVKESLTTESKVIAEAEAISATRLIRMHSTEAVEVYRILQDISALCRSQAKYDSQLAECVKLLSKHDGAMGCDGHLQVAGHLKNIMETNKAQAEKIDKMEFSSGCLYCMDNQELIQELKGE